MKRKLAALSIVAVLVAGTFVAADAQRKHRGMHGGHGMEAFGFMHGRALAKYQERLNLTDAQKQQLQQIVRTHTQQFRQQMQAQTPAQERTQIIREIFSDAPNQAAIQQHVQAMQQRQAQMTEAMVAAGLEINQVLTSEQRAEVHNILAEQEQRREKMRERMQQRRQQRQQQ